MIRKKKISLVIPCRNEEEAIGEMLAQMPKCVDEVVVVDNGSTDKTKQVAKKLGAVVVSEKRKDRFGIGYGYAHQKGMKVAKGDLIVTMDGDGTYPLGQIKEVVEYMDKKSLDFVTCSRFPLKNGRAISWYRQLGVWILNNQVKVLYGYPMSDILSGMWVMNRKLVNKLKLKEGGWDLSPEIKLEALTMKKVKFGQYHINHFRRENGESKQQLVQTGFNHLTYILRRWLVMDNLVSEGVKKWLMVSDMRVIKQLLSVVSRINVSWRE